MQLYGKRPSFSYLNCLSITLVQTLYMCIFAADAAVYLSALNWYRNIRGHNILSSCLKFCSKSKLAPRFLLHSFELRKKIYNRVSLTLFSKGFLFLGPEQLGFCHQRCSVCFLHPSEKGKWQLFYCRFL